MRELKHYTETDGFKIGDKVYRLNHYAIEEVYIEDIYDDYFSDDTDYICKWVKTNRGHEHLEDIFKDKWIGEYKIQNKKDSYDRYVTRGY